MSKGIVHLIGAGPGDPGLLTIRGRQCIEDADVVVFDRLVNPRLLSYTKPGAELVYAGKSPDGHTLTQDQINAVLVAKAREGKTVARVKGGDPYIFGRGGEEAEALADNGLDFEVVPGVTSAVAAPAYAGIPLTHRDFTTSVAIITGNEDPTKDESTIAWDKLSTGAGTLVFLMGMVNLPKIVERLTRYGRPGSTPVSVIRWGTWPEQVTVEGTLEDIVEKVNTAGLKNPAVIVVGEVCSLRNHLKWIERKPLFGKRILVTRSREQASALSNAITRLGGEALEFPTIAIEAPADWAPLDRAIAEIGSYNWVVFTSVNGVRYFFSRLRALGHDVRELVGVRICAIGPVTREALEQRGLFIEYVPVEYQAAEIARGMQAMVKPGDRILLPRADIAPTMLAEALEQMGARVDDVTAYRTVPGTGDVEAVSRMFEARRINMVTFTSSSTVRNFVNALGADRIGDLLKGVAVACIGPVTADTAGEYGLKVDAVAEKYTIEGLVSLIRGYFSGSGS
ncbi:MAG: uroporphyrinogen-III C-methyltransferase [Desulforudis sp.]|nr:uroporphyrinogen-III C-methyltransferase [Clostridia bacterium]MDQ7792532.1 uroporphyrinogen-III C-methyltransferase [Clostridia bacterium]RJX19501.1 MAG: uroporphyrinogen-III C-methyltransferase [Desulforudis sp.]